MPPAPAKPRSTLIGLGVAVVAGGLLLPRLFLTSTEPTPVADTPSVLGPLLKMGVGLIAVSAAVVALARFTNKRTPPAGPPPSMALAASLTVGGRCVVHLVEADGRRLLVGVDMGGVKALAELPPKPTVVGPLPASVPAGFADELAALLGERAGREPFAAPPRPPAIDARLPGR